jgi:multidrug resistance efflux pump
LKDIEAQLNRARAEAQQREVDALRSQKLLDDGAISSAEAEESLLRAKMAQDFVAEVGSRLAGQKVLIKAAQEGLQLVDGARSFSYPQIQVIELETEVADIQEQIIELNRQQEVLQTGIDRTAQELAAQKKVTLLMPVKGVIWSIDAQSGEIVNANAPILRVIDCQNVWIEAFVGEAVANSLKSGQVAEIRILGSQEVFLGKVQTLRAGTGRVTVGQYVVDPPPEIERRQLPVKVSTLRIGVDWTHTPLPEKFCGAGLSAQVSFPSPDGDKGFPWWGKRRIRTK